MNVFNTFFMIVFIVVFAIQAGVVRLDGRVPSSISEPKLNNHYVQISSILSPQWPLTRRPVRVEFFSQKDPFSKKSPLPEWGGGGAIGQDLIIVPVDKKAFLQMDLMQITKHELVHCAINRLTPEGTVPRWFHEGVAMMLAGDLSFNEQFTISQAIIMGRLLPYSSIDSVNLFSQTTAELAYSQSHQAVLFLVRTYGIDVLGDILTATRQNNSFNAALQQVLGLSKYELENAIRQDLNQRYKFVFFLSDSWVFWFAIILLTIAGFIATRIRNKRRSAQLEASEAAACLMGDTGENDLGEIKEEIAPDDKGTPLNQVVPLPPEDGMSFDNAQEPNPISGKSKAR